MRIGTLVDSKEVRDLRIEMKRYFAIGDQIRRSKQERTRQAQNYNKAGIRRLSC